MQKLTLGGTSLSSSCSIAFVGGKELSEDIDPRILAADMRLAIDPAWAPPDPALVRRTAAHDAGRFLEPLAPLVEQGGTNRTPPDLVLIRGGGSPHLPRTSLAWRSPWYESM